VRPSMQGHGRKSAAITVDSGATPSRAAQGSAASSASTRCHRRRTTSGQVLSPTRRAIVSQSCSRKEPVRRSPASPRSTDVRSMTSVANLVDDEQQWRVVSHRLDHHDMVVVLRASPIQSPAEKRCIPLSAKSLCIQLVVSLSTSEG